MTNREYELARQAVYDKDRFKQEIEKLKRAYDILEGYVMMGCDQCGCDKPYECEPCFIVSKAEKELE